MNFGQTLYSLMTNGRNIEFHLFGDGGSSMYIFNKVVFGSGI